MDDGRALRQAIRENPEDDALRLVYSDWLEENDRPEQAEFIRLHLDWCRHGSPDAATARRLEAAWDSLGLDLRPPRGGSLHVYDRGFIAGVFLEEGKPIRETEELALREEPIRVARFQFGDGSDKEFVARCQLPTSLIGLAVRGPLDTVAPLLEDSRTSALKLLHLEYLNSRTAATELLTANEHLRHLDILEIWDLIGDEGVAALARTTHLQSLKKLTLAGPNLGEDGMKALTAPGAFPRLTHFGLGGDGFDDASLGHLLRWARADQLVSLDLSGSGLHGGQVAALVQRGRFDHLQSLRLSYQELDNEAVLALAAPETLPCLRELVFDDLHWYGTGGDDEDLDLFDQVREKFQGRISTPNWEEPSLLVSPVGEADRIWQRLCSRQVLASQGSPSKADLLRATLGGRFDHDPA